MTTESGGRPPLALKVMRISRPSLAPGWEPFYSSSPAFSARSTESALSLQGTKPLEGYPKTLRDLSCASEILLLPASFGALQLGETFSAALALTNEAQVDIGDVVLAVDVQTASATLRLAEFGGGEEKAIIQSTGTMECAVSHDVKELGQHVLACSISYRARPAAQGEDPTAGIVTFRKFYKFQVTNPLGVRTKTHVPRSPSATLNSEERDKIFLEVHLTCTAPSAIAFEKVRLVPTEGWKTEHADADPAAMDGLVRPHDVRQCVFVLEPVNSSKRKMYPPGSIIELGQLDIAWRSSFGEPGRLLTSMLSRRVPAAPAPSPIPPPLPPKSIASGMMSPAPALPPHMQHRGSIPTTAGGTPRVRSPGPPSRPGSPAFRPPSAQPVPPAPQVPPKSGDNLDLDLTISLPKSAQLEKAFVARATLSLSRHSVLDAVPALRLVVQHHTVLPTLPIPAPPAPREVQPPEPFTPRLPSGLSTPTLANTIVVASPNAGNPNARILADRLAVLSPRPLHSSGHSGNSLPKPVIAASKCHGVIPLGSSAIILPPVTFTVASANEDVSSGEVSDSNQRTQSAKVDVNLEYMPIRRGVARLGGIKIFVMSDEEGHGEPRQIGEWESCGEVYVEG